MKIFGLYSRSRGCYIQHMITLSLKNHPQRISLNNEVHARPYQIMSAPLRVTHVALLSDNRNKDLDAIRVLCERYGVNSPNQDANFYIGDFPLFKLRWERHTEFSTYTISESCSNSTPFTETVLSKLPAEWLAGLPGEVITMLNLELLDIQADHRNFEALSGLFSSNTVAGSEVSDGAARVWSDFHIHADGFNRILIENYHLRHRQAGRLVQRILEIETYRMFALLGLPLARQYSIDLTDCDSRLEAVTQQLALHREGENEQQLLDELSRIAANVEHIAATGGYRFSATNAYYGLVKRRISELREKRIEGAQSFNEFMERSLAPAVRTCESVSDRVQALSNRIARVSALLRTRININLEAQNRDLLRSMDRRAAMQLRLQEMVEGLSVVVLSYYSVGLLGYALKGLKQFGVNLNIDLVIGISVPVIVITVLLGLRMTRRRLEKKG
ncbi:MAG: putative membrane-anchored protein [Urechidicola sp.]